MGMVVLDCPPDVAMVGLGESARVIVVPSTCNHASPLLVQGMQESMHLRTGVKGVADAAVTGHTRTPLYHLSSRSITLP
jgi:hypothetical protein